MKLHNHVLMILSLWSFIANGQKTPLQLIPPTPTAYALAKYGDVPVSLYTGVPDISIPIFTLADHDVSAAVSLSYHGSGIKVDEVASFVGLGWSLNAGGSITRVVKGRAETLAKDGTLFLKRMETGFHEDNVRKPVEDFVQDGYLYGMAEGQYDPEPDEFYYNFSGRSGKFSFDKNAQVVMAKEEPLKITWKYVNDDEQVFVVTDERGATYEFLNYEMTGYGYPDYSRICAWYLTRVTSATGNTISFEYTGRTANNQLGRAYASTVIELTPAYSWITPPASEPYIGVDYAEIRLLKINSQNGSAEFKYQSAPRKDCNPNYAMSVISRALSDVIIYKPDGSVLKKFHLSTGYFEANDAFKYQGNNPGNYNFLNYRLRLNAVHELGADNSPAHPPFSFVYNGDDDPKTVDPYTLPYRLSPAQDHWGYFNNSPNSHLIPGNPEQRAISMESWFRRITGAQEETRRNSFTNGADRSPNASAAKAGMLQEVHYPGGGYTEFFFEANEGSKNMGGVRIGRMVDHPIQGVPKETRYAYAGYLPYDPRDYYYKLYSVVFQPGYPLALEPQASQELLQSVGLPTSFYLSSASNPLYFVKIVTQPLAVLGAAPQVGYSSVVVSEPGNGYTNYVYSNPSNAPDYNVHEGLWEDTNEETNKLSDLFRSEYVSTYPFVDVSSRYMSGYITSNDWPNPEVYNNSWKRGMLTDKFVYSEQQVLLQESHFTYHNKLINVLPGFKVRRLRVGEFVYTKYFVPHALSQLELAEVKNYDGQGNNPVTSSTRYYYENFAHLQPTRVETSRSDGKIESEVTTYPLDYPAGVKFLDDMNNKHLLTLPVEKIKYLDDGGSKKIVSGSAIRYKDGGQGLRGQELKLAIRAPVNTADFTFSNAVSTASFLLDNRYQSSLVYDQYDAKSNLLQYTSNDDVSTSYLWGYQHQYPVAEIKNASVAECFYTGFEDDGAEGAAHTGKRYFSGHYKSEWMPPNEREYKISYWFRTGGTWQFSGEHDYTTAGFSLSGGDAYDDIRIMPADAQMSTYTYKPLVGLASVTDVNSRTEFYEYDGFGRLAVIRDDEKNILKKYEYDYGGSYDDHKLFGNPAITRYFGRNNCFSCGIGSGVTYTVPANKYFADSQQEADEQANQDILQHGQAYANQIGSCRESQPLVVISYNATPSNYEIAFFNTCSQAVYRFNKSTGTSALGNIPSGIYNVHISGTDNRSFQVILNESNQSGAVVDFNQVLLNQNVTVRIY